MLEIDRASAGRMIDRMEKAGWVERRPDSGDRRIKRLYLTPQARSKSTPRCGRSPKPRSTTRSAPLSATGARAEFTRMTAAGQGPAAGAGRSRRHEPASRRRRRHAAAGALHSSCVAAAGWPSRAACSGGCRAAATSVTENAYVKAHIVQIAPEVSGQVRRVLVRDHARRRGRRDAAHASNRGPSGWRSTAPRPSSTPPAPRSRPCARPGARR